MKRIAFLTKTSPFIHYSSGGFKTQMDRGEAAQILGLREFPRKDQVKEAHRRIMLINHPDKGGSPYLASKINEAKEVIEHNL